VDRDELHGLIGKTFRNRARTCYVFRKGTEGFEKKNYAKDPTGKGGGVEALSDIQTRREQKRIPPVPGRVRKVEPGSETLGRHT